MVSRRSFLRAGLAAGAVSVLPACRPAGLSATSGFIGPDSPQIAAIEIARRKSGRLVKFDLEAVAGRVDLGGVAVHTWSYGGEVPGPPIRVSRGDMIQAGLANRLPQETTVHWHGMAIRNDMDGVPGLTQAPVAPGQNFSYRFTAEDPGTYWYHPHVGVQLDRGLYGPVIVEDPAEPGDYDHDWTMVLDDWIDGAGLTPDQVLAHLRHKMSGTGNMAGMAGLSGAGKGGGMSGTGAAGMQHHMRGTSSPLLGGDAGDVRYRFYLINGRVRTAPRSYTARPGQRARIRLINAGTDTAFLIAFGDHHMTVTHADGYPVAHTKARALLIGQGERYDVHVTLRDGVFPLVALAEGKGSTALALIRTGGGAAPPATIVPAELAGALTGYPSLRPAAAAALPPGRPDVTHRLELTGDMMRYNWGINGNQRLSRFAIHEGQRVRVVFANSTTMFHPMHIHGHTFALGDTGLRKDTVLVLPGQQVACDFDATNPGQWLAHCHDQYHAPQSGMMAVLGYRA